MRKNVCRGALTQASTAACPERNGSDGLYNKSHLPHSFYVPPRQTTSETVCMLEPEKGMIPAVLLRRWTRKTDGTNGRAESGRTFRCQIQHLNILQMI